MITSQLDLSMGSKSSPLQVFSKQTRQTLLGINQQLEDLENGTKNSFFGGLTQQSDWNRDLENIKGKVDVLLEPFSSKEKKSYMLTLESLKKDYLNFFIDFKNVFVEANAPKILGPFITETFVSDMDTLCKKYLDSNDKSKNSSKNKNLLNESEDSSEKVDMQKLLEGLESKSFSFKMGLKQTEKLLDEIAKKLSSQKMKIENWDRVKNGEESSLKKSLDYYIFQVRKIIPDFLIIKQLKKSCTKHDQLVNDYDNLKTSWFEALTIHKDIEYQIEFLKGYNKAIPKIQELTKKLERHNNRLQTLQIAFESMYIQNLKEKSELEKIGIIEYYKDQIKQFILNYPEIIDIQKSMINDNQLMRKAWIEMQALLKIIEEKPKGMYVFFDDEMRKKLEEKREMAIKELQITKEKIMNGWNYFYINFNTFLHQINFLAQFKPVIEKMSTCFFSVDKILQDPNLSLYAKSTEFSNITDIARKKNKEIKDAKIKMLETKINKNSFSRFRTSSLFDSQELKKELNQSSCDLFDSYLKEDGSLLQESKDVMQLQFTDLYSNDSNDLNYFILTTESDEKRVLKEFNERKKELYNELQKYQSDLKQSYQTLIQISSQEADRINQEIDSKDSKQPEAGYISSFVSGVSSMIWTPQPEEKTSYGKVKSPFEDFKF